MKIKGPFGEVEVVNGALVKGVSPCKSCGKEQDCQAVELCDAKFGGWEPAEEPVCRGAAPKMDLAKRRLETGTQFPYEAARPQKNWAHRAARAICFDLCDRRGIKHEMGQIDEDVRTELVDSMTEIIIQALTDEVALVNRCSDAREEAGRKVAAKVEKEVFSFCKGCGTHLRVLSTKEVVCGNLLCTHQQRT